MNNSISADSVRECGKSRGPRSVRYGRLGQTSRRCSPPDSLKDVWTWLNEIGIEIGYARLSHHVGQLRRREEAAKSLAVGQQSLGDGTGHPGPDLASHALTDVFAAQLPAHMPGQSDPLANSIERERRRPGFDYNSEPDIKKLI